MKGTATQRVIHLTCVGALWCNSFWMPPNKCMLLHIETQFAVRCAAKKCMETYFMRGSPFILHGPPTQHSVAMHLKTLIAVNNNIQKLCSIAWKVLKTMLGKKKFWALLGALKSHFLNSVQQWARTRDPDFLIQVSKYFYSKHRSSTALKKKQKNKRIWGPYPSTLLGMQSLFWDQVVGSQIWTSPKTLCSACLDIQASPSSLTHTKKNILIRLCLLAACRMILKSWTSTIGPSVTLVKRELKSDV